MSEEKSIENINIIENPSTGRLIEISEGQDIVSESLRMPVCPEKVLEAHCKFATSIRHEGVDQTPQDRLIDILRRVYRSGKDPELEFNNFSQEFQTPQLRKALDAFEARRKKPKQNLNQNSQPTNTTEPQGDQP